MTTSSTTSSSTSSTTTTATLFPAVTNLLPIDTESAWLRSAHDERIETRGLPCRIYRARTPGNTKVYDEFDDQLVAGALPNTPINSWVILEPYQNEYDRTGDNRGKEVVDFPYTANLKFDAGVQKGDLLEIDWTYANQSGRRMRTDGAVIGPAENIPTRFKVVNRRLHGINADLKNDFYISPTEETWTA
jgi:hypothetical protein